MGEVKEGYLGVHSETERGCWEVRCVRLRRAIGECTV